MSKRITVRVQSPSQGTKRLECNHDDKTSQFLDKVQNAFDLSDTGWSLYKERGKSGEIRTSRTRNVGSYKIKHGDMLYLHCSADVTDGETLSNDGSATLKSPSTVTLDGVDQLLEKMDGKIYREKNEQLCRHGSQGKCLHCVPHEPYDEDYLKTVDPPIKFLSFHSYIRKLTGGADKGKFAMLENLNCKIRPGCTTHLPWPEGICTKCQPNAVTLNRQKYRHVDNIMFENPFLMERFLNFWRNSGSQRMGFLYGKFEVHKDVPLGIRAIVSAIYEPPQQNTQYSIELLPDDKADVVNEVAQQLGLQKVGWIFTDLLHAANGLVKQCRGNIDSHFLTAEECIMAADYQNKHPNPCKLSPDGHFGSKFVTVVVTGDSTNQIHFDGYQVSDQCMGLVENNCLIPTKDAPELGYIRESSNEQYVPDVFYKEKDQYGNEVSQLGRPLPVEYLLVDLPAAFPKEPLFTFCAGERIKSFPIENRELLGELQDFSAFSSHIHQFELEDFLKAMSDFHLLVYLATCDMLPLTSNLGPLLEAIKTGDKDRAYHWSKTEEWATVEQILQAQAPSPPPRGGSFVGPNASPLPPIGGSAANTWTCTHCTYHNALSGNSCEMCGLPRS